LDHVTTSSGCSDSRVLNFLIYLYASYKPSALLACFKRLVHRHRVAVTTKANRGKIGGGGGGQLPFDVDHALRICADKGLSFLLNILLAFFLF
jgi:hypothetical protein